MNILVSGTWREELAQEQTPQAEALGKLLAQHGHTITTGGGSGIPALVAESYKNAGGKKHVAILVSKDVRERVGEPLMPADEYEKTNLDYPQRNAYLVSHADAVIAMNGRLGTLTELIHAVNDYDIPAILFATSEIQEWVRAITPLKENVHIAHTPEEVIALLQV